MEGNKDVATSRQLRPSADAETVLLTYAGTARHLAGPLARLVAEAGLVCRHDEQSDARRDAAMAASRQWLEQGALLALVIGRRCADAAWCDAMVRQASAAGRPVLVFVEHRTIEWPGRLVPTLITDRPERIAAFIARGRLDGFTF